MTPQDQSNATRDLAQIAPIIPVIVVDDLTTARPMAEALVLGGLPVLEVTLRTPVALDAIAEMSKAHGGIVGAGTLLSPEDLRAAKAAGARFGVSPGMTPALIEAANAEEFPLLPGAATATEVMTLYAQGYDMLKFFPAEASGGAPALKAIGAPIPQVAFCPTGGVSPANAETYLALDNVLCAGGSWVLPKDKVANGAWDEIRDLARAAAALPR